MNLSTAKPLVERFSRIKVLVIGDLMLDHFIWGTVARISPEAPVPVVDVSRETEMPGGAGNVAVNMASLGAEVFLMGTLGQDQAAGRLQALFQRSQIHSEYAVTIPERPTTVKTRIVAHNQQVVRFDREVRGELGPITRRQLWAHIEKLFPEIHGVVLSDYGKGVINRGLIKDIVRLACRRKIPIMVDPKIENFSFYSEVTCITPNLKEAMEGANVRQVRSEEDVENLGAQILKLLKSESVLITRGERGMSLFEKKKPPVHIPTRAREVYDVTGAGDTVVGTMALALAAGAPLRTAAELANFAAGIVVGKVGTATVTREELLESIKHHA